MSEAIEKIWQDDLLWRKGEADQLEAFIISAAKAQMGRGEKGRAFTIAVDAPYGLGKTFFLKCLAEQMKLTHPVAYVDAWADDIADVPLVALAATLKEALGDELNSANAKARFKATFERIAGVCAVAIKSGFKLGTKLAVATSAAAATASVSNSNPAVGAAMTTLAAEFPDGMGEIYDEMSEAWRDSKKQLDARIEDFEKGKAAIKELKVELRGLVAAIKEAGKPAPIVIIIDELDRCRPTYAVKMLEEIKHLFDVPGIVFVLGMNGEQLSYSIVGAYGPEFDGASYIRRFIDRTYTLREADLSRILRVMLEEEGLKPEMFVLPVFHPSDRPLDVAEFLAATMRMYGATARDCAAVVNMLSTFCAITGHNRYVAPYLFGLGSGPVD